MKKKLEEAFKLLNALPIKYIDVRQRSLFHARVDGSPPVVSLITRATAATNRDRTRLVTVGERYQEVGQLGVGAMLSNEPLHVGDERATRTVRR